MVNPEPLTCELVAEGGLLEGYVNGRLDEHEAERFEAHYIECDRCWQDVQAALEVRAALGPPHPARAQPEQTTGVTRTRAWRRWAPALAAAAVLVLVIGIVTFGERLPEADEPAITRGAAVTLTLTVERSADSLFVSWTPVENAVRHRVRAFTGDGLVLHTEESVTASLATSASFADTLDRFFVQVEALDRLGAVVATSPLVPVP